MKTNTYEYSPTQYPSPYAPVQYTPTSFSAIFEMLPFFMMIMMMSIVMKLFKYVQKPETQEKIREVEKAALEAAKEWAVKKVRKK